MLAGGVDRDDVRVLDGRCRPRLAQEALAHARVAEQPGSDHLERDRTVEPELRSLVDDAHPPAAGHASIRYPANIVLDASSTSVSYVPRWGVPIPCQRL